MKSLLYWLAFAGVFLIHGQCSTTKKSSAQTGEIEDKVKSDVVFLSSDQLEGRSTGSSGEIAAGNFIADRFKEMGLQPKGENNSYFQSFTFVPKAAAQVHGSGDSSSLGMALVKEITGRNVIGYIDNGAPLTVIIGAHYDHLGWGDENSLWAGEKAIHNGADDNASGVSAVLQLASLLIGKNTHNNYLVMAFSGEEKGLWGSNYFCKNPTIDLSKVNYMLNLDMVGRLNAEKTLAINGVGTSPEWTAILPTIQVDGIKIVTSESGVGPSDHTSFYLSDIPVLHFFTGQHEDYHKPTDDADKVNYDGIHSVVKYILQLISDLDNKGELPFTKTKDEQKESKSEYKVTLGVMPDYLYSGEGMRIDGVREGRPAQKAGMQKGDIVLQIGDLPISDMKTYMAALGTFELGQKTVVKIKRGEEIIDVPVTWE